MALPPTLPDPAHVALPDRFLQDHGCLALAPLLTPALTTLDLKGNDIAGPGATALAEALRHTSIRQYASTPLTQPITVMEQPRRGRRRPAHLLRDARRVPVSVNPGPAQ